MNNRSTKKRSSKSTTEDEPKDLWPILTGHLRALNEWLDTPEGELMDQACDAVYSEFEDARLDLNSRRIVLAGGEHLTIAQASKRIAEGYDLPEPDVREQVEAWLEGGYDPGEITEAESDNLDAAVMQWLKDDAATK